MYIFPVVQVFVRFGIFKKCRFSLFRQLANGWLQTMKVCYELKGENVPENSRVIRPMCYVRETATRSFAENNKLPIIPENCPACFEQPKERNRMKQLLAHQELLYPRLFDSLQATLKPLMRRNEHLCREENPEIG